MDNLEGSRPTLLYSDDVFKYTHGNIDEGLDPEETSYRQTLMNLIWEVIMKVNKSLQNIIHDNKKYDEITWQLEFVTSIMLFLLKLSTRIFFFPS